MDAEEAAARLNGSEYGQEGSRAFFDEMAKVGLVAVFGASDDLAEFRGAIDDEIDAYHGTTIYLTSAGLLVNECRDSNCPHFARLTKAAATIEAVWGENICWRYETDIPHETFIVSEDGEPYCQGIVFELAAVRP